VNDFAMLIIDLNGITTNTGAERFPNCTVEEIKFCLHDIPGSHAAIASGRAVRDHLECSIVGMGALSCLRQSCSPGQHLPVQSHSMNLLRFAGLCRLVLA
jgi:hypothetical protein